MWLINKSSQQVLKKMLSANREEFVLEAREYDSPLMQLEGETASIDIKGILTPEKDFLAEFFFGANTSYSSIQQSLLEAEANPSINKIKLNIDSPGGSVTGLFETLDKISQSTKPVIAQVGGMAASAAYAIASQADTITASSRGSQVGSIGVVASYYQDENQIDITSTESPNKRPDVSTAEGRAIVREELDEVHSLFVETIARGRDTTEKVINSDYGRGSVFLADKAMERGMIDSISGYNTNLYKGTNMNLSRLKDEYPELYEEIYAAGKHDESERVKAHLVLGEASGAMKLAVESINAGLELTTSLQAEYVAAGLNKRDIQNREKDAAEAAAADGVKVVETDSFADQISKKVLFKMKGEY